MTNSKYLIKINKLDEIEKYKEIGITNFLFSVQNFSLESDFSIEELSNIEGNIYLNLNKILSTSEIEEFKIVANKLSFVKGIFFEDLGIYQVLKDSNIPLIWAQSHFVLNSKSINIWLEKVHSALISNELTKLEIIHILEQSQKPLVLNAFGHNIAMYSRRHLISAFETAKGTKTPRNATMMINEQNQFIANETKDGTFFHFNKPYNLIPYLSELPDDKILLYLIDNFNLPADEIIDIINGKEIISDDRFLNNKTIYKLED